MSSLLSPHLDLVFMRNIRPRLHLHLFERSIYPSHLIKMLQLSTDLHFHFDLRLLSLVRYSSTNISEVLEAASLTTPGDLSFFHHVFNGQALRVLSQVDQIDASKYPSRHEKPILGHRLISEQWISTSMVTPPMLG